MFHVFCVKAQLSRKVFLIKTVTYLDSLILINFQKPYSIHHFPEKKSQKVHSKIIETNSYNFSKASLKTNFISQSNVKSEFIRRIDYTRPTISSVWDFRKFLLEFFMEVSYIYFWKVMLGKRLECNNGKWYSSWPL